MIDLDEILATTRLYIREQRAAGRGVRKIGPELGLSAQMTRLALNPEAVELRRH